MTYTVSSGTLNSTIPYHTATVTVMLWDLKHNLAVSRLHMNANDNLNMITSQCSDATTLAFVSSSISGTIHIRILPSSANLLGTALVISNTPLLCGNMWAFDFTESSHSLFPFYQSTAKKSLKTRLGFVWKLIIFQGLGLHRNKVFVSSNQGMDLWPFW